MSSAAPHKSLTRAVIVGVSGRMGQALLRAAPAFPQLIITGAIASPGSLALGRDAGELAGIGEDPALPPLRLGREAFDPGLARERVLGPEGRPGGSFPHDRGHHDGDLAARSRHG